MNPEERIHQVGIDIMNFVLSKNNKATIKEIIERFENIYTENEIRACMTPLLIAGKLDEHIVYSVVKS